MKDFSNRSSLVKRQQEQRKRMEENANKLRDAVRILAKQKEGELLLRFLFLASGGHSAPVAYDKEGRIDDRQTFLRIGRKSLYSDLQVNMDSDTMKLIERNNWEEIS